MVDIIIPTYKARKTLSQALDSLVAQTKKMFIVTISQDGDGEDYSDIIEEYTRRGLHIRLITGENGGPGMARQRGMDADTMCDYFIFLDADDMLCPRAVETLYNEAKRNCADIIASSFCAENAHNPATLMDVNTTPVTWTHGKCYRAQYLREKNIRFIPELRTNEDSYFNLVAWNCATNRGRIEEVTYIWRANQESITRMNGTIGFYEKHWESYVFSQVRGIIKVIELNEHQPTELIAMTLINIYQTIMKSIYFGWEKHHLEEYLELLNQNEFLHQCASFDSFWQIIAQELKACEFCDDCLIFYKVRFIDWFNSIIKKEEA